MPLKDPDARRAYQREYFRRWYARNREYVIAKVAERKRTEYVGVCINCGGPTQGNTPKEIPAYCAKPDCASVQRHALALARGEIE